MRTFVYDDWNLIHETIYTIDGGTTNTTEVQYFWGLDLSGTIQGAGGVGGLLAVSRNGQLYFPTFDNNGNVTKYIDESGNVVAAYEYDDFGRTISQSGPLADFFRHRFSTKYGYNLYAFCENVPIHSFDLLGLTKVDLTVGTVELESKQGMRDFIKIEARVIEPPKNGGKLNFIQLKRHRYEDWDLDIQGTPGPYYYRMIDMPKYTNKGKDGNQVITLYDAPGGAISEEVFFYTAVVEVNRKCELKQKYSFSCYDRVQVIASVSWSFIPGEQKPYRYSGKSTPLVKRQQMIPTLQQLINFATWKTELCPSTRIEVVP